MEISFSLRSLVYKYLLLSFIPTTRSNFLILCLLNFSLSTFYDLSSTHSFRFSHIRQIIIWTRRSAVFSEFSSSWTSCRRPCSYYLLLFFFFFFVTSHYLSYFSLSVTTFGNFFRRKAAKETVALLLLFLPDSRVSLTHQFSDNEIFESSICHVY